MAETRGVRRADERRREAQALEGRERRRDFEVRREPEIREVLAVTEPSPAPLVGLARNVAQARIDVVAAVADGLYSGLSTLPSQSGRRRAEISRGLTESVDRILRVPSTRYAAVTVPTPSRATTPMSTGAVVREGDDDFVIEAELPGVEKEDVTVKVRGGQVTISAEREEEVEDEAGARRTRLREFAFAVALPGEVEEEGGEAALENGVLTVRLPKTGPERYRRIGIG